MILQYSTVSVCPGVVKTETASSLTPPSFFSLLCCIPHELMLHQVCDRLVKQAVRQGTEECSTASVGLTALQAQSMSTENNHKDKSHERPLHRIVLYRTVLYCGTTPRLRIGGSLLNSSGLKSEGRHGNEPQLLEYLLTPILVIVTQHSTVPHHTVLWSKSASTSWRQPAAPQRTRIGKRAWE